MPQATAKTVCNCPIAGMPTDRPSAIGPINPMNTNALVPKANGAKTRLSRRRFNGSTRTAGGAISECEKERDYCLGRVFLNVMARVFYPHHIGMRIIAKPHAIQRLD